MNERSQRWGKSLGQRIDRRDAIEMDQAFLAVLHHLRLRMVDRARLERDRFAEHDHFVADLEIILHERQVPPPAMQPAGAVIQNEFEHGFGAFARPLHPQRLDSSPRDRRDAHLQFKNGTNLAPVVVAGWRVQQQILDCENSQPRQQPRPFLADPVQGGDRIAQCPGQLRRGHKASAIAG